MEDTNKIDKNLHLQFLRTALYYSFFFNKNKNNSNVQKDQIIKHVVLDFLATTRIQYHSVVPEIRTLILQLI